VIKGKLDHVLNKAIRHEDVLENRCIHTSFIELGTS
jgi:hypothetical protein